VSRGEPLPVSTVGGAGSVWRRDGKGLFASRQGQSGKMMAVSVTPDGSTLRLGRPVALFDLQTTEPSGEIDEYDAATIPAPDTTSCPMGGS
jgi:hypothetical protein